MAVEPKPKRKAMTPARRLRIWELAGRACECGEPVPVKGTVFDHRIPFAIAPHLDDWPNLRPLCERCNHAKTYGTRDRPGDITTIAKTKRQAKMSLDVPRREPRMKSGGKLRSGGKLPGKGKGPKLKSRNDLRKR